MERDLMQLLAARTGHFRMESGYHAAQWFELDRLFTSPQRIRPFVTALARPLRVHGVDVICGPKSGGAKLAAMLAAELGIDAVASERIEPTPGDAARLFSVRYALPPSGRRRVRDRTVVLVDDAISAGSAVRGTLTALHAAGARVVVLGALIVFGENAARFAVEHGLPLEAVVRAPFESWTPDTCPLCRSGAPLESVSDSP